MEEGQVRIPPGMIDDADGSSYTPDEVEFMLAMDRRKVDHPYPTCADVLEVAKSLGYRKTAPVSPTPLFKRSGDNHHWVGGTRKPIPNVPLTVVQVFHFWAIFQLPKESANSSTVQSKIFTEPVLVGWALTEGEADEMARSLTLNLNVSHTEDEKLRGGKSLFPSRPRPRKT